MKWLKNLYYILRPSKRPPLVFKYCKTRRAYWIPAETIHYSHAQNRYVSIGFGGWWSLYSCRYYQFGKDRGYKW